MVFLYSKAVSVIKKMFLLHNKILTRVIAVVVLLLFALLSLLRLPSVQEMITTRAVAYLHNTYGINASVGKLYLSYWGDFEAEDLVVYDDLKDTLFSIEHVTADASFYNIYSNRLLLDQLYVDRPYFNLYLDSAGTSNLMRFVYMLADTADTQLDTDSSLFFVKIYDLQVDGGRFRFDCRNLPDSSSFYYVGPMLVKDLSLRAQDVEYADARVDFDIDTLSLVDENRLRQVCMKTTGFVSDGTISLPHLLLSTSRSSFDVDNFLMTAPTFLDYVDYVNMVHIKSDVNSASVALADLEGFVPFFTSSNDIIAVKGYVNGTVNRINSKNMYLARTDSTWYKGDIMIQNITTPDEARWRLFPEHLHMYKIDLLQSSTIGNGRFPKFESFLHKIQLPYLKYSGAITGYFDDFMLDGEAESNFGKLTVDLQSMVDSSDKNIIDASLYVNGIDVGKFKGAGKEYGALTGTIDLDFVLDNDELESGTLDADISSFEYSGYLYNDLFVDVSYRKSMAGYVFYCDDPNVQIDLKGVANKIGDDWNFSASADVERFHFSNLGFAKYDRRLNSSFDCKYSFHWNKKKDFGLNAIFNSVRITSIDAKINDDDVALQFLQNEETHFFSLQSSYFNAELRGDFTTKGITHEIDKMLSKALPSVVDFDSTVVVDPVNVRIRAFSDSLTPLFSTFYNDSLRAGTGFEFLLNLRSENSTASVQAKLPSISYGKKELDNIAFNAMIDDGYAQGILRADVPFTRRSYPNTDFTFSVQNDTLFSNFTWNSTDTVAFRGSLLSTTVFGRDTLTDSVIFRTEIAPANVFVNGNKYFLDSCTVYGKKGNYHLVNARFGNDQQELLAYGALTQNLTDTLFVHADNVDMSTFNSLLGEYNMDAHGILSGRLTVAGLQSDMIIETEAAVDGFVFNDVDFGVLTMQSNWIKEHKLLNFSARAQKGNERFFTFSGEYIPKQRYLYIDALLDSLNIRFIDPFLGGQLAIKQGSVSGSGRIAGELSSLRSSGFFQANSVVAKSNYLKTVYRAAGDLHLENDRLVFDDVKIRDFQGGNGVMSGYFSLLSLPDLDFDLLFKYNKMKSLRTVPADNDLYYGDVSATGTARLFDKEGDMFIVVSAAFEDGSQLFIPISNSAQLQNADLLRFTSDSLQNDRKTASTDEYINMDLDLRLTPQNEIQIIMDQQAGDVIKAKGAGNILVSIKDNSDVLFMGEYNISQGEYLFTLMNLLNKRFTLLPSSSLYFSGNLEDTEVDIDAVYRTKASLQPLMGQDSTVGKKRVKVECLLSLTGNLYNPDVRFDINLPDEYQGNARDRLQSLSEDERNQQFLSLLVLNRFMEIDNERAPDSRYASAGDASVNSMEVLSNQFSNWLSSMSDEFDFGVNYRPGDQVASDELEVGVSTQILNDRISIDYNRAESFGAEQADDQKPDGYFGDVTVEMKLTKNGKLRLRGFTRDAEDDPLVDNDASTNGVGISFTDEFNSFSDLFGRRKKDTSKDKRDKSPQNAKEGVKPEEQRLKETK